MDSVRVIARKATLSYKGLFSVMDWKTYLMVNISNPIMQMLCFTILAHYVNGSADVSYWLIGNVLVMTYFNAVFGVGVQLTSEKFAGTLKLLVASPSSRVGIFLPRAILHIFDGLSTVLVGFLVGFAIFGFRLDTSAWLSFILILLVASFSAMSFGLVISCMGLLTRDLNLILNVASMAMLGLTGANFPIDRLPSFMRIASRAMPLTRSIELGRLIHRGEGMLGNIHLLYGELLVGVALMLLGVLIFGTMERYAIKKGVLELF